MTALHWLFSIPALALSVVLMLAYFRLDQVFRPNVIMVMFLCHIFQQLGAAVYLLLDPNAIAAPIYFLACVITALLIPIGGMIGHAILPAKNRQHDQFHFSPIADDFPTRRATLTFFLLLFGFCLILFVFYVSRVPASPWYKIVSGQIGGGIAAVFARIEGQAGDLGRLFGMGLVFFMPFLFLVSIIGIGYFKSVAAKLICFPALAIAVLYNAWAMDKSPVAMLFLLALIVLVMKKHELDRKLPPNVNRVPQRRVEAKKKRRIRFLLIFFVFLMIGYPVFVFVFTLSDEKGFGYMIAHVFLRIVYKPAINSYTAFEAFTYHWDYTYFTDVKRFVDLFGISYFDLSERIAVYKGQDPINNAPPTAIGNFYGQGGWAVLVGGVLFAAALFKVIENAFYRAKTKTPVHLALYALLLYGAFRFSWANYHTIFMTETIFPMMLMLLIWSVISRIRIAPSRHLALSLESRN